VFDGNLQGLVLDLAYTEEQARCVCVDARAVVECLKVLYDAKDLVDEIHPR
jgi:peptidase S46-like protein